MSPNNPLTPESVDVAESEIREHRTFRPVVEKPISPKFLQVIHVTGWTVDAVRVESEVLRVNGSETRSADPLRAMVFPSFESKCSRNCSNPLETVWICSGYTTYNMHVMNLHRKSTRISKR